MTDDVEPTMAAIPIRRWATREQTVGADAVFEVLSDAYGFDVVGIKCVDGEEQYRLDVRGDDYVDALVAPQQAVLAQLSHAFEADVVGVCPCDRSADDAELIVDGGPIDA